MAGKAGRYMSMARGPTVEISPRSAARRASDNDVIGWGEADGAGRIRVMDWRMTEFH